MSLKKRLIPALVGATLALSATATSAVSFNGVFIFGDSQSDAGYFRPFLSAIGLPASTVAGLGRFTTNPGPVWSELIAQYYGGNPNPSNAGGGIYAQGGARVAADSTSTPPVAATQRPVSTQVTEYLSSHGGVADPNALYALWAGNNDIFQLGAAGVASAAPALVAQAARLQAAGARYILVFGSGDGGKAPGSILGGPAAIAQGTAATAGFNTLLFTGLKSSNIKVIPVDTFSLINDVIANASAFGISNTTGVACAPFPPFASPTPSAQFCGAGNLVSSNAASTYLFADYTGHSTTATNAILADFVKSLIDGPNAYSIMAEVPLSSRAAHIRTLDEGLRQGQAANVGKVAVFAAGEGSKFDISRNALSPQADTKNRALTVGVTMRASDAVTVGAAAGSTKGEARMGGVGQFDLKENALSVFGSARSGPWYASFMGSFADVDYDNIQRVVKLGQVNRTATASTKGSNASANLTFGYDHQWGNLSIGPFLSLTSQLVTVNAFTEDGAGSANLNIFEQTRRSRVTSGGVRASMQVGNWTPFARVSMDRDAINAERLVGANPVTVVAGNAYDIPAYRADSTWVTGSVGVHGKLAERVGLSVVYSAVSSKSNEKQDGVTASVSFDF
ncbi:MAG: autotransporter domain-containing protein [Betaproteobacteria bacterium]